MEYPIENFKISIDLEKQIIDELELLLGCEKILFSKMEKTIISLSSGLWLIPQDLVKFLDLFQKHGISQKRIKYCGIFLGVFRAQFGLSLEALYFFKDYTNRYIIIKGKTLEKFLYGKVIQVKVSKDKIKNFSNSKIVIMNEFKEPVGIGNFKILETEQKDEKTELLEVKPIVDLGLYLRKENQMF